MTHHIRTLKTFFERNPGELFNIEIEYTNSSELSSVQLVLTTDLYTAPSQLHSFSLFRLASVVIVFLIIKFLAAYDLSLGKKDTIMLAGNLCFLLNENFYLFSLGVVSF